MFMIVLISCNYGIPTHHPTRQGHSITDDLMPDTNGLHYGATDGKESIVECHEASRCT